MEQDNRTRTYSWEDPAIGAGQAMHMAGLDYIEALQRGELPPPPLMHTLDFKLEEIAPGKAVFSFQPQEFHYNPIGSVHGGVITAALDSAMGCALHATLGAGTGYTTLELKVNFLKAVNIQCGRLYATGKLIHSGRTTALTEAQLHDQEGRVYAHAVSTCLLLR
jgi:uncharacterized protein (TIGR00369 family)